MLDENQVNAYPIPEFCRRNKIGVTSAYRARKAGLLEFTKIFGKTVVTVEAEAKFRQLAAEGKLQWPKKNTTAADKPKRPPGQPCDDDRRSATDAREAD